MAGAHLLRRSRARGGLSWCSTVGCPCEAAGGPAGGIERLLAAPSTSCSEMSSRSPEPPTAMPNARLSGCRFLRYKWRCLAPLRHQHDTMIGDHRNRRCGALRITVATEQKRSATLLLFLRHRHLVRPFKFLFGRTNASRRPGCRAPNAKPARFRALWAICNMGFQGFSQRLSPASS